MIAGILSGTVRTSTMPLRNSWNSRPIRTALVEPCGADAHWFSLMAQESKCSIAITHYPTGTCALAAWKRVSSSIDLMVVSDTLPMLTIEEFIQGARSLHPFATIVVARGGVSVPAVEIVADASYPKPLTVEAIREMVLRATPIRNHRPTDRTAKRNVPVSSLFRTVHGTRFENCSSLSEL
jgi:hypothetical protein